MGKTNKCNAVKTPQRSLLPSFVTSFLSQIWSISSSSCLFDYLFSHQCQSSAVANVLSSSLIPDCFCFCEMPEAIQTANMLHKHASNQSTHTDTQMLLWALTGDIKQADNLCPILWYALNTDSTKKTVDRATAVSPIC